MSDAQQESQFKDFLNQHLLPPGDINHDSSEEKEKKKKLGIFTMLRVFSLARTRTPDSSLLPGQI